MMTVKQFLANNKWLLIYLFWMCGTFLFYACFLVDPEERHELFLYNALFTLLILILFPLMTGWVRKAGLIFFSLIAIVPSLIETGWFLMDGSTLIRNQFYVIYATNPAEASGLLSLVQMWQWGVLACYLGIGITLFIKALRESDTRTYGVTSVIGVLLTASLILIPDLRYNVPCINFYNSYRGYRAELQRAEHFIHTRHDLSNEVYSELPDSTMTIVVIIGESLNRNHCSLYGYNRPTTPRLTQRADLVVYQDVRSADFMTQTVIQQILTFVTKDNPDARWENPTLPELLNTAGWHTYWFDPYEGRRNSSKSMPTGFSSIAKLCTNYYLCGESEQYDGSYLNHLDTVLQDSTVRKKAVFLHLIGNHFPYSRRYPPAFKFFQDSDICSPYKDRLTAKQKAIINSYDDAVRYNDWFVDSVINRLDGQHGSCAMLYFPDHGEEVFDYDCYAGRSFNHITRSLYEIPCLFWQNGSFAKVHPLYIKTSVSYCTENMIHTLLDLFAVSYSQKDTCRSLFRQLE